MTMNTTTEKDTMNTKILINLTPNGLPGIYVSAYQEEVDKLVLLACKNFTKAYARKVCKFLKQQTRENLPTIMKGETYHDGHELMNKEKFDNDLVNLAVFDWYGNNRKIHITPNA